MRNYRKEYDDYHARPDQKKKRANRNAARRKLAKQGRVRKGDGMDVHHKDGNPLNNSPGNLQALRAKVNRSLK
jgi:hypothetical protein